MLSLVDSGSVLRNSIRFDLISIAILRYFTLFYINFGAHYLKVLFCDYSLNVLLWRPFAGNILGMFGTFGGRSEGNWRGNEWEGLRKHNKTIKHFNLQSDIILEKTLFE